MSKWIKLKGTFINLEHVMLVNKAQKTDMNFITEYYIEFTFVNNITSKATFDKNMMRFSFNSKEEMEQVYEAIEKALGGLY